MPRINHVEISPKRGRSLNELTKYRYQVILHVGPEYLEPDQWSDWRTDNLTLERIREQLRADAPTYFAIEGVPNQRIARELELMSVLKNSPTPSLSVGALRANVHQTDHQGIETDDLEGLAKQAGYRLRSGWGQAVWGGNL